MRLFNKVHDDNNCGNDWFDWAGAVIVGTVIFLAYLPALTAGFLNLDDVQLFKTFMSSEVTLKALFAGAGGDYFRPLTILSFFLDVKLGYVNPMFSHGFNVALHCANSLLILNLSRSYLHGITDSRLPSLAAALLFGLSPLATEPVVWISGRTDLLCCFFFLLCLNLMIREYAAPPRSVAVAISICFLFSLLSKESSIALVGIVPAFIFPWRNCSTESKRLPIIVAVGIGLGTYLFLRFGLDFSVDTGVAKVVGGGKAKGIGVSAYDSLAAFGFYFGKLIWPFPLNFAIVSINKPLSAMMAIAGISALGYLYLRIAITRLPILIMVLCMVPPIMAIHGKLAWTPYAERYLYLPMVGFAMLVGWGAGHLPKRQFSLVVMVLLLLAFPTLSRAATWANPEAFWRETIVKSPTFPRGYVGYAAELIKVKRYDEAEQNLKRALEMQYETYFVWQNLATIYLERGEYPSYHEAMVRAIQLSKKPTELYITLIQNILWKETKNGNAREGYQKAAEYYLLAYERDKKFSEGLYNAAKLYLILGDHKKARRYFKLFLDDPGDSLYQSAARKMLERLSTSRETGGTAL